MSRYPRLEAMRASRKRADDEIAAPYVAATQRALAEANAEKEARKGLERLLRSPIIDAALKHIGRDVGEHVFREIMKSVRQQVGFSGVTTLELPTAMLMAADPKSLVARVVEQWKLRTAPRMAVRVLSGTAVALEQNITTIDIRLPEMGYREEIENY